MLHWLNKMLGIIFFSENFLLQFLPLCFITLGVWLVLDCLKYPDMSSAGSFVVGAAMFSISLSSLKLSFLFCLFIAAIASGMVGVITCIISFTFKVNKIIAGFLTSSVIIVWSSFFIEKTISLLDTESIFLSHLNVFFLGIYLCIFVSVILFFTTKQGLEVLYIGGSPPQNSFLQSKSFRINMLFLFLGNAIVGIGGVIQVNLVGGYSSGFEVGVLLNSMTSIFLGKYLISLLLRRKYLSACEKNVAQFFGVLAYSTVVTSLIFVFNLSEIRGIQILICFVAISFLSFYGKYNLNLNKTFI